MFAREGQTAPGVPGAAFSGFENLMMEGDPGFVATVAGPGINASNDRGIWVVTSYYSYPVAQPVLLVREGDTLMVAPGDVRVIEEFIVAPSRTRLGGESGWLSSSQDITFAAEFTDGSSGVFTITYIPEPGVMVWGLGAISLLVRPRRRG